MAERLAGVDLPWCVAAGWALDLFRGEQTRPHDDLEIAVPATGFDQVAVRFPDCDFFAPYGGQLIPATPAALEGTHQTWALERSTGRWRFDVFREPHEGDVWICRRDESIRKPYSEIIRTTPDGIPYLLPEIVLLFKAKNTRDKDEADFRAAVGRLDRPARRWLDDALALVHPEHPWRAALAAVR
jgi:Aminoglycoside-2''-adenylyltransferase